MHAHARSESQASSSATHSLEQRHVISLSRFSKKQIWIQSQIVRLEESVLPSFESLDGVLVGSDVGLESKWQEMEEIEQATNELDQGELRSLRLLAKAASQKSLSPEDTDLIEITLSTLFSLDKLLHLLRVRSKALKLLQTRIKWNAQVAQVEKDRKTLLDHALPRFLDKARWRPDPHADTVADLSSSGPLQSSPLRNSVLGSVGLSRAPSSQQTRQMRAEIVSLDLAALTARLHTLLHSTMPASGKTLDALIDSSPEPLPERYLDAQDALEARTKAEVAGVDDFCRALAKQWKEADEIASSLDAQRTDLEQLGRDVREATLKLPADELASAFERRSAAAQDAQARIEGLLAKIRLPCHPERAPEQQHHNAELQELLQDRAEQSQQQLLTVQAGVNHYRQAVTTLLEAQAFIRDAAAALADLRQARTEVQPLVLDAISLRSFSDSAAFERDGLHRTGKLGSLEAALAKASQDVLPHAAGIASTLQQYGIDSNVRRQVQEAMLALASAGNAARSLLEWERQALGFRARAWTLWKAVENEVEAAVSRTAAANAYIARSRWRPASNASPASPTGLTFSEESTATAPASRLQVLEAQVQQLREELAHVDARLLTALDTSLAGARDAQTTTRRSEQLLVAVQRQKTEVQAVEALALSLIERLEAFAVLIEDLHLASVESILAPQTELETDCNSFSTGLSTRALLACPSETTLDVLPPSLAKELATLDDSVRSHVNTLATRVSALLAERKAATVELRGANEVREGLVRLQGEVATSHEQLAAIVSSAHASDADLRTRQARLSSLSTASSEMRARVAELDSVPRSGRLPKKAQRTLESLREVAVAAVDELVHGIREAQKRTEEELETMTFQADSQRQAEEEERAARAAAEELARDEEEEEERVEREAEANRRAEEDEEEAKDKRRRQATESEAEREPSETGAEEGPPTQSTAGITVSSSNPSIVFSPSDEDIQELSTRLRQKTATSEDVFGPEVYATEDALLRSVTASAEPVVPPPLSLSSPGLASVSAVSDLRDAIAELDLDSLLRPLPTSLSRQRLPTTQEAEAAQRQVSLAHAHLEDLACDGSEEEQAAYAATRQLLEEKAVDVGRVSQLAKFASLASESDAAISKLLDAVDDDKENEEGVDVREDALLAAECAVERTKEAARPVEDDPRVLQRLQQLQGVWRELRSLALREDAPHSPTDSQRSISRSSSIASELSTYSRRTVSGQSADNAARKRQSLRSVSRSSTVSNISSGSQAGPPSFASPRLPSSSSLSRIPVTASPRARTKSTSSAASLASRLPIPSSPAIPTPRRSASNSLAPRSTSRKSSRDAPTPTISTPTQLLQQSLAGRAKSEATSVNEEQSSPPSATRRSSNRRSSKKHLDLAQRPNHYRANSKRKLDVAVARIVNGMNVPVTITPAETHHDEVGRYFIGDPPRLYYARILRSKTVMLRVGGGWQELSSFLLTHFDSVFAPAQQVSPLQESARGHVSPQDARDSLGKSSNDARPWQNAAAFRASLARSTDSGNPVLSGSVACAGSGVKGSGTPRAVSHDSKRHMPSRRISGAYGAPSVPPIDLTALLVKTSTRSPPVANTHIPIQQQRSKSASIPWRL